MNFEALMAAVFLARQLITLSPLLLIAKLVACDPILSCAQTPYPQVCSSMVVSLDASLLDEPHKAHSSFRNMMLRATMDRAANAHLLASTLPFDSLDAGARAAWADCMELFKDTVDKLNRSVGSPPNDDVQTWLSAARANQETCRDGFLELGASVPSSSLLFASNNLSESISNSLAVNGAMLPARSAGGNRRRLLSQGFPAEWMKAADRKLLQSSAIKANLVVAKDGSGNYRTISDAVEASVRLRSDASRFVIYVKSGVYFESVEISNSMKNLMMIGDGIDATIVTGSKSVQDGFTTYNSATFAVGGDGFIARDMTFENTAGPEKNQAVALRSASDLSVFYRCSFKGYQDTLYVYSQRQFYRDCDVYGTVDFIFGDAAVVLQNCNIYVRKPMSGQKSTVTAQGRSDPGENTGISIHGSVITAASDLRPFKGSFKTYLGRPWKQFSRTVFMKSQLDGLINPAGWLEWSDDFALSTLYYGEYMNTGAGAATSYRVNWGGYHVMGASDANKFTVGNFLAGDFWIPATGVPYATSL